MIVGGFRFKIKQLFFNSIAKIYQPLGLRDSTRYVRFRAR